MKPFCPLLINSLISKNPNQPIKQTKTNKEKTQNNKQKKSVVAWRKHLFPKHGINMTGYVTLLLILLH